MGYWKSLIRVIKQDLNLYFYLKKLARSPDPLAQLEAAVLKKIVGGPYMGGAYEFTGFKKNYYDALPLDKKKEVQKILLKIIRSHEDWRPSIPVRAAYVGADIDMSEAKNEIHRMIFDPKYGNYHGLLKTNLDS